MSDTEMCCVHWGQRVREPAAQNIPKKQTEEGRPVSTSSKALEIRENRAMRDSPGDMNLSLTTPPAIQEFMCVSLVMSISCRLKRKSHFIF